ncbi:lysozyme-like [Maniola jurtina]|uniref:lysozyme-like n=1 Tax=Maniola jurtina TaxID=191418 RepID=UPI001E68D497|nr:lysozyme-like [Maniola jurtina]
MSIVVENRIELFENKDIKEINDARNKRDTYEYNYTKKIKTETTVNWSVKRTETGNSQKIISNGSEAVTEACLRCICQASSGCQQGLTCVNDVCGPFKITWAYWVDAGKLTLPGVSQDSADPYSGCTNDAQCAADTVKGYMRRLGQDCNGDGVVNCYDYMAIHRLGGYGCKKDLPLEYVNAFHQCVAQQ